MADERRPTTTARGKSIELVAYLDTHRLVLWLLTIVLFLSTMAAAVALQSKFGFWPDPRHHLWSAG